MITRLPTWVWSIAWVLACIAGMVNVIGLLGFDHQAVTHLTGSTSLLAESIANLDASRALHIVLIIGAFLAGTIISGVLIKDSALQLGRRYGLALMLEAVLLTVAMVLLGGNDPSGMYFAASACGLQNAMMSTYSGTVIRTTHISGMFTDLGISIGHRLRGLPVDQRRLRLCLSVISGFLMGGVAGTFLFSHYAFAALWMPVLITALSGLGYSIWCTYSGRQPVLR